MKALALFLLALGLGAGVLFVLLDSDGGARGGRTNSSMQPKELPVERGERAVPEEPRRGARESSPSGADEPRRQAVGASAIAEVRGVYEGVVIGEGAPVPGAHLEILRHAEVLGEAETDARGRFRLPVRPLSGAGTLRVRARGFVSVERNLPPKPAGGTILLGNLRLLRGQRLTGHVYDGRGDALPDAEVRVEPMSPGADLLVARGRTGGDGLFEIADAPPGTVQVSARARGYGEKSVPYSPGGPSLELRLEPGVDLTLVLRTRSGAPVAGAEITIQTPNDPRASGRVAESDEQGRVRFEGLGTRLWNVRIAHPEFRPMNRPQMQATGVEQVIECQPWPGIAGLVRAPGGQPIPAGTRVQALPASAPGDVLMNAGSGLEVARDGTFRVGGLRQGDWRVRVSAPGFAPATSAPVKLANEGDGHAGTIELQAGAKLVFALTVEHKPVVGAEVELFAAPPAPAQLWALAGARGSGPGKRALSGSNGLAMLENLPPGRVWVVVYAEGSPPKASGPHDVSAEASPTPIAIELERGGRLQGQVKLEGGAPAAGAQLRVLERGGHLTFPLTLASGEDGRYTSAWMPAGPYTIEAFAPEDPTQRSGPQEIELHAGELRQLDLSL